MEFFESYDFAKINNLKSIDNFIKKTNELPDGSKIKLYFDKRTRYFTNRTTFLSAVLDYLRKERGFKFELVTPLSKFGKRTRFFEPVKAADSKDFPANNTVYYFENEDEIHHIKDKYIKYLAGLMVLESGVLGTLSWCLYEVFDNIFQHSEAKEGLCSLQVHESKVTITIVDLGIGIPEAMKRSPKSYEESISNPEDAIALSVKKGVTSKGNNNQGNGLYGLVESIKVNEGDLQIYSGHGGISINSGRDLIKKNYPDKAFLSSAKSDASMKATTLIDIRFNVDKSVKINKIFNSDIQDYYFENIDSVDENNLFIFDYNAISDVVGSRAKSNTLRNLCLNMLSEGVDYIQFDFDNFDIVSSSFADEVFGKLREELDEDFKSKIFIKNAKPEIEDLINAAISNRMKQSANLDY